MKHDLSEHLFQRAKELLPGGVNSPVRAFRGVGGTPVFFKSGQGAWLTDVDANRYVDYVGSWGPLILGHAYKPVIEAVVQAAWRGTSFGAPHEGEVVIAEKVKKAVPSMEVMRFVNSGTEATSAALRLARGFTGRDLILKLEGCYHGASDSLLVKAGSGVETLGLPDSPGVPAELAKLTLTVPFNDLARAEDIFKKLGDKIAGLILEPVVGNMGLLAPKPGYLEGLRKLTEKHGTLLIFDEVMTGFRLAYGGAQERYKIRPDLSTFGKVIGGGLPVGAYGGRADIMRKIAPDGPIYQAGTLSGNPLAVAAGAAALDALGAPGVYERLEETSAAIERGLTQAVTEAGVAARVNRVGSMWTLFFTADEVFDYPSAKKADTARFGRFFHAMLERGIYLPPSQFESAFVSLAHGPDEVRLTLEAAREALRVG
ncbi:MAG: glutamate-1-semialdehyde 2,1-aminomutase [Deltaproteobacteria bacterium]|nr:glutamate-1-semialdehyde 2,1-aminomutase [Deltaproteobacteria bacterium]